MDVIDETTAQVVNALFRELKAIFPAFRQAWPTDEEFNRSKLNWIKAFQDSNISDIEQLRFGLEKCRLSVNPFAPSVGQFIAWCKPEPKDFGFPDNYQAFRIAVKINEIYGTYNHPHAPTNTVINHAIRQIGAKVFRELPETAALKLFENCYQAACKQFKDGKLELIQKSLADKPEPHETDKQRNDAARAKAMETFKAMGLNIQASV